MRRFLSRAGVLTIAGVVGLTASLVGVAPGGADPGDQDASFGAQGVALAPTGTHVEQAYGEVDVVASLAGESWTVGTRGNGSGRVLQILRHNSDGTDPAAGAARVVHDLGTLGYASAATEDGLGGAYVVVSTPSGTGWAPMLVHVLADRTLDAVFGQQVLPGDLGRIEGLDVARHAPTGALFVAVMHRELIDRNVTVIRTNAAGVVDAAFGVGGVGVGQRLGEASEANFGDLLVATDGSALVTGSDEGQLRVRKWTANGAVDPAYGVGTGKVDYTPAGSVAPNASSGATLDSSGRLLIPWTNFAGSDTRAYVARITAAGVPDPAFGGGSVSRDEADWVTARAVATTVAPSGTVHLLVHVTRAAAPTAGLIRVTFDTNGAWTGWSSAFQCATRPQTALFAPTTFVAAANNFTAETWCTPTSATEHSRSNAANLVPVLRSALTVGPDGRIFVHPDQYTDSLPADVGVLTPGGQPDTAVGVQGWVGTSFGAGADFPYQNFAAGTGGAFYVRHGSVLARFLASGTLDAGFGGGDGLVDLPAFHGGHGLMALPDGGAMVAGRTALFKLRVVKYLPSGVPDPAFDGDGIWDSTLGASSAEPVGVATGGATVWSLTNLERVIRILPSGAQDLSFGTGGEITGEVEVGTMDAQGRLLLARRVGPGGGTVEVRRYSADGVLVGGYGAAGVAVVDPPAGYENNVYTISAWPDGSSVLGLVRYPDGGGSSSAAWALLTPSGEVQVHKWLAFDHAYQPASATPDGRIAALDASDGLSRVFLFKGLAPATPTLTAVATGPTTATLTSTGDGAGLTSVRLGSEVGTTTAYGSAEDQPIAATRGDQQVTRTLTGLAPATTYHARAVLSNASGTTKGVDVTFTTPAAPVVGPPLSKNPTVTITLPKKSKRTSIRAWKTIKGTAAPAAATPTVRLKNVQLNLVRKVTRKKCIVYTGKVWRKTTCKKAARVWFKAKGTTSWKRKITGLVRGSYTVRARSKDIQGKRSTAVAGVNRFRFKLKKR